MKYRILKKGEIKRKGDQLQVNYSQNKNLWTDLRAEIGSKVTELDLSIAQYRRPIRKKRGEK